MPALFETHTGCNSYEFGATIANVGDINNDGIDDIAVTDPGFCRNEQGGIPRDFLALFDSRRNTQGQFGMSKRAFFNQIGSGIRFGQSVAAIKDPRGLRVVASSIGFVSVFTFSPSSGLTHSLTFSDPAPSLTQTPDPSAGGGFTQSFAQLIASRFGWRLKNIGDTDGDNVDDLAITAPLRDGGTSNEWHAGAIYVYSGNQFFGGVSSSFQRFSPNETNGRLGYGHDSVTGLPDITGDGKTDLAVGAMNGGTHGGGAVYVLSQ